MASVLKTKFEYKTKRLTVRFLRSSDYAEWKRSHSSTEKKKNRWDFEPISLGDEKKLKSHFKEQLSRNKELRDKDSFYSFYAFEKKTGKLIGTASIMDISRGVFQNGYIGYRILNNFWGNGYGKEFTQAMVKIGFGDLNLHRLEAGISPYNIRSIRLVKSLKFRKEGRSLKRLFLDDEWQDMMIYALTKEDLA
ncbi:MAG: GNAT family protein [Bacteriovoracaceae bacterium]|jgi:ribosomal-protein-alanine N-acetyltransferase|nr:GNAT family protein [Bacteriovoracaceae bacterium]|tara:strand:+ start:38 stop:616 length:579 start_codon:yes stop_codon:yes gene_type:complete